MLIRNICEGYPGLTPPQVESWSLDHIYTLGIERSKLERLTGATVTGTPQELAARGVIPPQGGETLLQILKREKAEREARDQRGHRRRKRAEARERALAYKRKLAESGN